MLGKRLISTGLLLLCETKNCKIKHWQHYNETKHVNFNDKNFILYFEQHNQQYNDGFTRKIYNIDDYLDTAFDKIVPIPKLLP